MEHIKEQDMKSAILNPDIILGSDGMVYVDEAGELLPFNAAFGEGRGHPRGAGSYGTYLRMAIDNGSLSLPTILAKTSYLHAKFLEQFTSDMKGAGSFTRGQNCRHYLV